ncbi:MAG: hypothetical protein JWM05_3355 [Acidimicrobiales bacterium]|nr:hypothetical protein [Acidimicrobiales bacterium]
MVERPVDGARRALHVLHDGLWDADAGLVRLAPGVTPGQDLSAWNLHAIRETALGALVDLRAGDAERAATAIRSVLAHQHLAEGVPWSGTFKVCAEEQAPPEEGAVEWFHYDPNWRQFVGCILAFAVERFGTELSTGLRADVEDAIVRCVRGEPVDRIPRWYTNPNLMHAWLTAWVGARSGDARLVRAGEDRMQATMDRFARYGDVDEYSSPTYDGIDLFAAALWANLPPTPRFAAEGAVLAGGVGARLGRLFHPALGAICGPYIRAYGLGLDRYVSLAGEWLALAGADASRVLPPELGPATDHVHDLYFLDLFDQLADGVTGQIAIAEVSAPRRHEQRFGAVVATSQLHSTYAMGVERGRVPVFARDQYVPFTAHFLAGDAVEFAGVKLGPATRAVDAVLDDERSATLTAVAAGSDGVDLVLMLSSAPTVRGASIELGRLTLDLSAVPTSIVTKAAPGGTEVRLAWSTARAIVVTAHLR